MEWFFSIKRYPPFALNRGHKYGIKNLSELQRLTYAYQYYCDIACPAATIATHQGSTASSVSHGNIHQSTLEDAPCLPKVIDSAADALIPVTCGSATVFFHDA
jgi:hypothetical protein